MATIESITITPSNPKVELGKSIRLTANIYPSGATGTIKWTFGAGIKGATVDQNGVVTGLFVGSYSVRASAGSVSASATVEVVNPPGAVLVSRVTISPEQLNLALGQTAKVSATVSPSNATNKKIMWETPQGAVTTVDQNGNVKATRSGTSRIIAKSVDKNAQDWIMVTVTKETAVSNGIIISPGSLRLTVGQKDKVTATVTPAGTANKSVIWSVPSDGILSIDQGGNVTALKEGSSQIKAKSADGNAEAWIQVVVSKPAADPSSTPSTPSGGSSVPSTRPETPTSQPEASVLIKSSDWNGLLNAASDGSHFMAFMEKAHLAYDYTGERILCFNEQKNYIYVYMLKTATWHKMSLPENVRFKRTLNSYPQTYISAQVSEYGLSNARILNYSTPLDVTSRENIKGVIATRPIDLGEPDIRKTIKSIRIRGQYNRNDVRYILLGSMDGINWGVLPSLRGGSYKLYRLILLTNLSPTERISWIDIDYESRFANKLR